jgi:hypothetical protein
MKKLIYISVILLLSAFGFKVENKVGKNEANVMTSVEIIVIDAETEEPVPAALVKFNDIDLKAYTDFDGLVSFQSIQNGRYNLEVSLVSYSSTHLRDFKIDQSNNQIVVKLKQ